MTGTWPKGRRGVGENANGGHQRHIGASGPVGRQSRACRRAVAAAEGRGPRRGGHQLHRGGGPRPGGGQTGAVARSPVAARLALARGGVLKLRIPGRHWSRAFEGDFEASEHYQGRMGKHVRGPCVGIRSAMSVAQGLKGFPRRGPPRVPRARSNLRRWPGAGAFRGPAERDLCVPATSIVSRPSSFARPRSFWSPVYVEQAS
mgnify:CR=1 FL=1